MENNIEKYKPNSLFLMPFEQVYEVIISDNGNQQIAKNYIADLFGISPEFVKNLKIDKSKKTYEVIFSKEVQEKLNSGEFKLMNSGEYNRANAMNGNKIVEQGKIKEFKPKDLDIMSKVTMIAHIISSMDNAIKLDEIKESIEFLTGFVKSDRKGELRGVIDALRKQYMTNTLDEQELKQISYDLQKLESRFFETYQNNLSKVKNPLEIGFFKKLFYSPKRIENNYINQLKEAHEDMKAMIFCNRMNVVLNVELNKLEVANYYKKTLNEKLNSTNELFAKKISHKYPEQAQNYKNQIVENSKYELSEFNSLNINILNY